ncbi:uncharacterized protein LOC129911597 [Episyrphus balteatus]|uniref:uncharacterized protein LOC129911597 n=1 Tax=Episyrphus balteatus TaxID=286459 RepID=UPI002484E023|nr:uncharacterized protein LOC129911597 [Episyrphus balteatus]
MEELKSNLLQTINRAKKCETDWENEIKLIQMKMQEVLFGPTDATANISQSLTSASAPSIAASPQQMKKRPKRLSAVVDKDEDSDDSQRLSLKSLASEIEAVVNETIPSETIQKTSKANVQPEPEPEHIFARPQRAAKLKVDNFKEPSCNAKLRRPDNPNETAKKIKKENETRPSQIVPKKSSRSNKSQTDAMETSNVSVSSVKKVVDESLVVVADKEAPIVDILSEEEDASSTSSVVSKKKSKKDQSKTAVIKIKKEKLSFTSGVEENEQTPPNVAPVVTEPPVEVSVAILKNEATAFTEETLQTTTTNSDTTSTDANSANGKRTRKKKAFNHRPIKEERR